MRRLGQAALSGVPLETLGQLAGREDALRRQSEALGFDNALEELEEKNTATIGGDTYIRLQQYYEGIPVYGKTIVYAANEQGELTSVTGNVQDIDPDIDLTSTVIPEQAQESIRAYAAEVLEQENTNISYSEPNACIYNGNKLAYLYTVTMDGTVPDDVLLAMLEHSYDRALRALTKERRKSLGLA